MTKKEFNTLHEILTNEFNKAYNALSRTQNNMRNACEKYSKCEITSDQLQKDLNDLNKTFTEKAAIMNTLNDILDAINYNFRG